MTKLKMLIAALSVFTVAGMTTACSKHRANIPATEEGTGGDLSTNDVDKPKTEEEILKEKMAASTEVSKNLKAIANSRYSEEGCDSKTAEAMTKGPNHIDRVLRDSASVNTLTFAAKQIISRNDSPYCKVNALAITADKVAQKFIYSYLFRATTDQILSENFDKNLNQASLVASVIGPMLKEIKTERDAIDQARQAFADKASTHDSLMARIESTAVEIEEQLQALDGLTDGCELGKEFMNCSEPTKGAVSWVSTVENQAHQATANLDIYQIVAGDQNLDSKNEVLQSKVASLESIRDAGKRMISKLSGQNTAETSPGPDDGLRGNQQQMAETSPGPDDGSRESQQQMAESDAPDDGSRGTL